MCHGVSAGGEKALVYLAPPKPGTGPFFRSHQKIFLASNSNSIKKLIRINTCLNRIISP